MSNNQAPTRVRFFPGQFLQAEDLEDEQAYHVAMHRLYNSPCTRGGLSRDSNRASIRPRGATA